MNIRFQARFVCLSIALRTSAAFGTDLRDGLAHPEKYDGREVEVTGIARVPGYFYLLRTSRRLPKPTCRRHFVSVRITLLGRNTWMSNGNGSVLSV